MVPRNIVAAVGPPNALFSRISFIQPNEGWLSAKRSKVVEADLLNVVEERMPDLLLSEEPRALGSAEGSGGAMERNASAKAGTHAGLILEQRQEEEAPQYASQQERRMRVNKSLSARRTLRERRP